MTAERGIDLAYRPPARLFPLSLEHLLLARIKGSARRRTLRRAIEDGTVSELPSALLVSGLSERDRQQISRIHPSLMGGEYLPDLDDDELEVARIELRSVTGDVISVRAKKAGAFFRYRVVDEYGDDCLVQPTERRGRRPLTLGAFTRFVLRASALRGVLAMNAPHVAPQEFVRLHSRIYPTFDALVRTRIDQWFPEAEAHA